MIIYTVYETRYFPVMKRVFGSEHPVFPSRSKSRAMVYGAALPNSKRLDEAESTLRDALPAMKRVLGDHHNVTLGTEGYLRQIHEFRGGNK